MLESISKIIAKELTKNDVDSDLREICAYGIETAIYTILSTVGLLLIGCLSGTTKETIVLIIIYYSIQTTGGGYHARSHISCFVTMLFGLLICILIMKLSYINMPVICTFVSIAVTYLLINPIHLHPNKSYLSYKSKEIISCARKVTIICAIFTIFMIRLKSSIGTAAALGLIVSALSRYAGGRQKHRTECLSD